MNTTTEAATENGKYSFGKEISTEQQIIEHIEEMEAEIKGFQLVIEMTRADIKANQAKIKILKSTLNEKE